MIENIHNELKKSFSKTGKKVLFGISPFAIYRTNDKIRKDGWEKGSYNSEGALQCYSELYSDVYKWMKENWIDYVVPQVYFPFERVDVTYHDLTNGGMILQNIPIQLFILVRDYIKWVLMNFGKILKKLPIN